MLRRTHSTFIAPGGMQHSFSVVNASPKATPSPTALGPPSRVTVTYGKQTKAFGRQRLQQFDYYQALALLDREFGIVRPSQDDGLEVTFYRPGGYDRDTGLMGIDHESWGELLMSVNKIELKKPKFGILFYLSQPGYQVIASGCILLLFLVLARARS